MKYIERKFASSEAIDKHVFIHNFLSQFGNKVSKYNLYKKGDGWHLGIGSIYEIELNHKGELLLSGENLRRSYSSLPPSLAISKALSELELSEWCAYGTANFEYSYLAHEIAFPDEGQFDPIVLSLIIPQINLEIHDHEIRMKYIAGDISTEIMQYIEDRIDEKGMPLEFSSLGIESLLLNSMDKENYQNLVSAAIKKISEGEFLKVILSRRVFIDEVVDPIKTFFMGLQFNAPARSFLFKNSSTICGGFSPETVVEINSTGDVSTQPLAGTRSLGLNDDHERYLKNDLLSNTKEIAEHAMSVKLSTQEMESCCVPETVMVSEFMNVIRRGSVQHLASRVVGKKKDNISNWDVFSVLFPAVTASGISKKQALQFIKENESSRGLYSGAYLFLDSNDNFDAALVLRSFYQYDNKFWLQAGAGIIGESRPEREFEETCEKLNSLSKYIVRA